MRRLGTRERLWPALLAGLVFSWGLTCTGHAAAQGLEEQVKQLQQADHQRQEELNQLKANQQMLLEELTRVRTATASEPAEQADGESPQGTEEVQYGPAPAAKPGEAPARPGGVSAGYTRLGGVNSRQDGFFIKNADDTFVLRIHNRMQFRYAYDHFYDQDTRNGIPALDRQEDRSDLHFAREYFTVNGNAWSKDLFYQLTIEAFTAINEDIRLRYLWVDYNVLHGLGCVDDYSCWRNALNIRAGLWKGWFGREFPASDGEMQLIDRALATHAFNEGRVRGLGLFGSLIYFDEDRDAEGKPRGPGRLAYFFELIDSINNSGQAYLLDTRLTPAVPLPPPANPAAPLRQLDVQPTLTGRVQYDICRGWYTYYLPDGREVRANDFRFNEENDLAYHEQAALQVGVSYIFGPNDFDNQPASNALMGRFFKGKNTHRIGADAAFKYRGWSLTGEYYLESINQRHDSLYNVIDFSTGAVIPVNNRASQVSQGFYVRGGFFLLPRCLDFSARVSGLFANPLDVFQNGRYVNGPRVNDAWEYTIGFGYYPTGHQYIKIQVDGTYLTNSPISSEKSEFTSATHESDLIGRLQLQVEF